jgi:hypothetical protein
LDRDHDPATLLVSAWHDHQVCDEELPQWANSVEKLDSSEAASKRQEERAVIARALKPDATSVAAYRYAI